MLNLLFALFTSFAMAQEKTITIAVIDTGFGASEIARQTKYLCRFGHKDFSKEGRFLNLNTVDPVPADNQGHGTNIVGLIVEEAKLSHRPFCIVVLKYHSANLTDREILQASTDAINYAKDINAAYINYSGGGIGYNAGEAKAVKDFIDAGGTFVAAAGNDGLNLGKIDYYPAEADKRVIVVGNLNNDGTHAVSSNYGDRVNRWDYGVNAIGFGLVMTGTSQATARVTGKLLGEKSASYDKDKKTVAIRK